MAQQTRKGRRQYRRPIIAPGAAPSEAVSPRRLATPPPGAPETFRSGRRPVPAGSAVLPAMLPVRRVCRPPQFVPPRAQASRRGILAPLDVPSVLVGLILLEDEAAILQEDGL